MKISRKYYLTSHYLNDEVKGLVYTFLAGPKSVGEGEVSSHVFTNFTFFLTLQNALAIKAYNKCGTLSVFHAVKLFSSFSTEKL